MRRKHLTFSILFLLLCSFIALVAVSQQKTLPQLVREMQEAEQKLNLPPDGAWPVYDAAFDDLDDQIEAVIQQLDDVRGVWIAPKLNPVSQLGDGFNKNRKVYRLSTAIQQALTAIENKREEVENLWLDAYDAWQAYHNAVAAYNSHPHVSPEERLSVPGLDKYVATPLYLCQGPCYEPFETLPLAMYSHSVTCFEKHGSSGSIAAYWSCEYDGCPRSEEHWRVCCGTCGRSFPPKRIDRGQGNYDYVADSPHYVTCSHESCVPEYYTC